MNWDIEELDEKRRPSPASAFVAGLIVWGIIIVVIWQIMVHV